MITHKHPPLERTMAWVMALYSDQDSTERPTLNATLATLNLLWAVNDLLAFPFPVGAPSEGEATAAHPVPGVDVYWGNGHAGYRRSLTLHVPPYPDQPLTVFYVDHDTDNHGSDTITSPAVLADWLRWRHESQIKVIPHV